MAVLDGDLLGLPARVGAIVNAADPTLLGRDGIGGQILRAGGNALTAEIRGRFPRGAAVGTAVTTSAPGLGADHVIHAVMPDFRAVGRAEGEALLRAAYRGALAEADRLGVRTVAFGLLSADARRGPLQPHELQALAEQTLRTTPTRVRNVFLVRQAARAGAEDLAALEAQRLQRAGRAGDQRREAERVYAALRRTLGIRELDVAPDGDCFYNSMRLMFGDELRQVLGGEPTVQRMRRHLGRVLREEFARIDRGEPTLYNTELLFANAVTGPRVQRSRDDALFYIETMGQWNSDAGDSVPQFAALAWGIPITLLGRERPHHIGPAGEPPRGYLVYDAEIRHYLAARSDSETVPAEVLYETPDVAALAEPATEIPEDPRALAGLLRHLETYRAAFEILRASFRELTERSPAMRTSDPARRGDRLITAFYERLNAYRARPDRARPDCAGPDRADRGDR